MKPEKRHKGVFKPGSPHILPVLLFFFITAYQQVSAIQDTVNVRKISTDHIHSDIIIYSGQDRGFNARNDIIPPFNYDLNRTKSFLDTLKTRASKSLLARKLFDFVIVNRAHGPGEKGNSDASDFVFRSQQGKIIRHIEVRRLMVFGSDINNPDFSFPNKIESLLNKTHVNSNENIIRKYLLFHEGDSISALELSDNERLLRNLPYIDDSRIIVTPVSDSEADITVITKDVYSLGVTGSLKGLGKGSVSVFDENIFGTGHEFGIEIPWNNNYKASPGFGANYEINNIFGSFSNLATYYYDGLGAKKYGFSLIRKLISSETKYAGGISVGRVSIYEDLDEPLEPVPVKYTLQDYWLQRSFLINRESVSRVVIGARYTNNNVYDHPEIQPETYYNLQRYKLLLGSVSFSMRKFYKANLIYSYGRTEDIPFGGSANITFGREINEFKNRIYSGGSISFGETIGSLGYVQSSLGVGTFFNNGRTEQGVFSIRTSLISRMFNIGSHRIRNFIKLDYTRGFDRYIDEDLGFIRKNGFSGFGNDSIGNAQRFVAGFESVLFSPLNFYGIKLAGFVFADVGALYGLNEGLSNAIFLTSVGLGLRIRNDNLIFNTLQIRIGYFPSPPRYSRTESLIISGEQLLEPASFEPHLPSLVPYE